MGKSRFTTGDAATRLGMPFRSLKTWLANGWLDSLLVTKPPKAVTESTGWRWTAFTLEELALLALAKDLSAFLHPAQACILAASERGYVQLFLAGTRPEMRYHVTGLYRTANGLYGVSQVLESSDPAAGDWRGAGINSAGESGVFEDHPELSESVPFAWIVIDLANLKARADEWRS